MAAHPIQVIPAAGQALEQIASWITTPAIFGDAFGLPAAPDPALVRRSLLVVKNGQGIELQKVRFWSVLDPAGVRLGFAVDYGWNQADDPMREIDIALPGAPRPSVRVLTRALVLLVDELFSHHGTTRILAQVRIGTGGQGFPRLFAALGGQTLGHTREPHPVTGEPVERVGYTCTAESFYRGRLAQQILPRRR